MDTRSLLLEFTERLQSFIEDEVIARARAAVGGALGNGGGRALTLAAKTRKKPPRQLCPVPGCKNTAAPAYGMVCSQHTDIAKAKIKKYREARRAKKMKASA